MKTNRTRNLAVACAIAGLAFLGAERPASANILYGFTVTPGAIDAGGQSTIGLNLSANADCCNYFAAQFWGGTATLYSGDGASQAFNIAPSGGSYRSFSTDFTYLTPGNYQPYFTVTNASYTENYTYSYTCGFFQTCFGTGTVFVNAGNLGGSGLLTVNAAGAAVPLPASWTMLLIGLVLTGFLASHGNKRRRLMWSGLEVDSQAEPA